jgi:hypothetical protein
MPMPSADRVLCLVLLVAAGLGAPDAMAQKDFSQPPQMAAPRGQAEPPTRGAQSNTRFTLANNSDMVIDALNISPVDDDEWGDDLLGTLSLPGHSRVIAGPKQTTGCSFDVRVVFHDQREEVLRRQNLCDLNEIAFTGRTAHMPQRRSQGG